MELEIDWSMPWYNSVRGAAERVPYSGDWLAWLNRYAHKQNITNADGLPLHFIEQSSMPPDVAYESYIARTGGVPTRAVPHDYFNALVWLSFPNTKSLLNRLHCLQIALYGISERRGPVRDAITLLDENGAIFVVAEGVHGDELARSLSSHDWLKLFCDDVDNLTQNSTVYLFGHAVMEKLVSPFKAITAHALIVEAPRVFFSYCQSDQRRWLDEELVKRLRHGYPAQISPSMLTPLPIAGLPGWWEGQSDDFYRDRAVFRPKRGR